MLRRIRGFENDCETWLRMQNVDDILMNQSQVTLVAAKHAELQAPLLGDYKKQSVRPTRVMIALIDQLPRRIVKEISP